MSTSPALAEIALQKLQSGVLVIDADGRVRLLNAWLRKSMSSCPDATEGMALLELFPELAGSRLQRAIEQGLQRGLPAVLSPGLNPHPLPLITQGSDGPSPMSQAVQVIPLLLEGVRYCVVAVTDVSASMRRETLLRDQAEKLSSLSLTDELTGVANRRRLNQYLDDELRRAKRTQRPLSVILIDIDHFKDYNDHYGHLAGDDCLVRISRALQAMVQRGGDLLARYGGEEFCVVLGDTDESAARSVAENLRAQVEALRLSHPCSSTGRLVTISLGVAGWHASTPDSATGLLLKADRALYRAKQGGRNRTETHQPGKP